MTDLMRGLPIRQPYIDMILDGRKTWEMRESRFNFRERIALIQQGQAKGPKGQIIEAMKDLDPAALKEIQEAITALKNKPK